jgi:hypothetical protein
MGRTGIGCAVLTLLVGSCAGKSGKDSEPRASIGGSAGFAGTESGGAPTAGAGAGAGAVGGGGRGGTSIDAGMIDADTPDAFEVCKAEESSAVPPGLDIYVVFDHSGSMAQDPNGQNAEGVPPGATLGDCPVDVSADPAIDSRWCLATNALASFFTTPPDRDVRVALQFMTPATNYDVCGPVPENPHATPRVDLTPLPVAPDHALLAALEADFPRLGTSEGVTSFEFGTRIEGALHGIVAFTSANQDPSRRMIGVLITDGDPNQCQDSDLVALGRIPGDHNDATGIPTFIVGMTGATANSLETLARFGGAPEHAEFCDPTHATCHYWTVGDGAPDAFRDALQTIQQTATIPCEYALPEVGSDQTLDPGLVQVKYTASGEEPREFIKVEGRDDCDASLGGWFYDDPVNPRRILLCEESCDLANDSAMGGTLSVAYGCRPIVR